MYVYIGSCVQIYVSGNISKFGVYDGKLVAHPQKCFKYMPSKMSNELAQATVNAACEFPVENN